ncbi:hypothetical protein [Paenibacillus albus]|uniref:Uncharacterized protein n=1 Tax=Paenibacillus albus TaxID=2495582 RepID=A0A3S9ACE0_9BACL|nr:hypothetical protein [Paenibacillus albus]AZN43413.1 hypothetical protein EJC50_29775 [Paenibacillus albus]
MKEEAARLHERTNTWHHKHNTRVAEFHKLHAEQLEQGTNGTSWLARWERFVYTNGKRLIKKVTR